jgi:hypothetical protein
LIDFKLFRTQIYFSAKPLDTEDMKLVYPVDAKAPKSRIQAVRPVVPWLRKTEYITAMSEEGQKVQKEDR